MILPLCVKCNVIRTDTASGICRVCDPLQRLIN